MWNKLVSVLLCAVFIVGGIGGSASASNIVAENELREAVSRYTYLHSINPILSISNRTAAISGTIKGYSNVTKITYEVTLQVKDGSSWRYVDSWNGSQMASSATYSYSKSGLISGNTYRTKTVVTIYSGSNSETVTAYSVEKKA